MKYILTTTIVLDAISRAAALTMTGVNHQQFMTETAATLKLSGNIATFTIPSNHGVVDMFYRVVESFLVIICRCSLQVNEFTHLQHGVTVW